MPGIIVGPPTLWKPKQPAPIAGRNTSGQRTPTVPNNSFLTNVTAPPPGWETRTGRPKQTPAPARPSESTVTAMQKFLRNQGYNLAVDGVQGPLTTAAARDWRTSRNPQAWNTAHAGHGATAAAAGATPAPTTRVPTSTAASPKLTSGNGFYTTIDEAKAALPPDIPGAGIGFQTGKGYYIKTPAPAPATPATSPSTAPTTPSAPSAPAGGTSLQDQAKQIVDSILRPLLDNIKQQEDARAAAGQAAIEGYTQNAQDALKGIDFGAPYAGAASGANAINDAELQLLQGQGSDLASSIGAKLAAAGVDPSSVTGRIGADTSGAAAAGYTGGGATVQDLLSKGADATDYGQKLPGITALAGLQDTKGLQGQVAGDLATQLGNVSSQAPSIIQQTLAQLQSNDLANRQLAASTASDKRSAAAQAQSLKIQAILASGYDPATGTLTPDAQKALAKIVGTNPGALTGGSASSVGSAASAAARTASATAAANRIDPSVSKILGYAAHADGTPVTTPDGKIIPVDKTGKQSAPKTPTANELNTFVDTWFTGKPTNVRVPAVNPDGTPVTDSDGAPKYVTQTQVTGKLNYTEAYKRLRALNVPDAKARQLLDSRWKRGEGGRAWLTNEEQTALRNARLSPKAHRYKSLAYLDPEQVAALTQAHRLPPGQTVQGKYVIDETY